MKKIAFLMLVLFLPGCAAQYVYESKSSDDPKITFGDRFGGGSINSPARTFLINIASENKCSEYKTIGALSNHWMGLGEKTKVVNIPKDSVVSLVGIYIKQTGSTLQTTCTVGPVSFESGRSKHYSIDISLKNKFCRLSIVEMLADGTYAKVEVNQKKEEECVKS